MSPARSRIVAASSRRAGTVTVEAAGKSDTKKAAKPVADKNAPGKPRKAKPAGKSSGKARPAKKAEPATVAEGAVPDDVVVLTTESGEPTPEELAATEGVGPQEEGFVYSEDDDSDEPEQQVVVAGATADPVKDYLKQIGKVPLLNAEQEVELAKRIEAGLFAEEQIGDETNKLKEKVRDEYEWISEDGRRAKNHLLEANLRLVVSLAKRYTGRGMLFLDLIQEGNLGLIR